MKKRDKMEQTIREQLETAEDKECSKLIETCNKQEQEIKALRKEIREMKEELATTLVKLTIYSKAYKALRAEEENRGEEKQLWQ